MKRCVDEHDIDAILRVLGHDLRSPARALRQYKMLLDTVEGVVLPKQAQHYFDRMDTVLDRMDAIHDALSLVGHAGDDPEPESDDPRRALWDLAREVAETLEVELTIAGPSPPVAVAEDTLKMILTELIKNIRDHAGADAVATLEYDGADLVLRDNGAGIHPRHHHELFLPFRPVPYPNTDHRGLGLTLVSRAAVACRGSVVVDLPDAGGVEVRLTLPMRDPAKDE